MYTTHDWAHAENNSNGTDLSKQTLENFKWIYSVEILYFEDKS